MVGAHESWQKWPDLCGWGSKEVTRAAEDNLSEPTLYGGTVKSKIRQYQEHGSEGFTLIELLIVIVIIGILAAIVVFSVSGVTNNGAASACKQTLNEAQTAVEAFYANNGNTYPANLAAVVPSYLKTTPSLTGVTFNYASLTGTVTVTTGAGGPSTC